jgi:hypothetical protein
MVEEDPRIMPADAIVAIVFAAFATEAFINELAEIADMHRGAGRTLAALADVGREAEDSNAGVTLKFQVASIALAGATFRATPEA